MKLAKIFTHSDVGKTKKFPEEISGHSDVEKIKKSLDTVMLEYFKISGKKFWTQ